MERYRKIRDLVSLSCKGHRYFVRSWLYLGMFLYLVSDYIKPVKSQQKRYFKIRVLLINLVII